MLMEIKGKILLFDISMWIAQIMHYFKPELASQKNNNAQKEEGRNSPALLIIIVKITIVIFLIYTVSILLR